MVKANISNQANRIVYYSLVSYSHKNECALSGLLMRLSAHLSFSHSPSLTVLWIFKTTTKKKEWHIGDMKSLFPSKTNRNNESHSRYVPIRMKLMSKTIFEFQSVRSALWPLLKINWEHCEYGCNLVALRPLLRIGSISMEINSVAQRTKKKYIFPNKMPTQCHLLYWHQADRAQKETDGKNTQANALRKGQIIIFP